MNYLDWSNEYFETAEKMASLIRLLNEERKHARPVQKKQIDKKLMQYKQCRYECLDTARLLFDRYRGIA